MMDTLALASSGALSTGAVAAPSRSVALSPSNSFAELGTEDFFKLLLTQLTNQDPLEPTGNEELLNQIASIREIELSSSLTQSLQRLTGQQTMAAASAMIGQFVTGQRSPEGAVPAGLVVGARFDGSGEPVLQLADGGELPLTQVVSVQPPLAAGESMIGALVSGWDRQDPRQPRFVEGVVNAARLDVTTGDVVMELDTGDMLRLRDMNFQAGVTG